MTPAERVEAMATYWLGQARQALASAESESAAGRLAFATNRCYYAAFYAASAVLLLRGHKFRKHSGVRSALHKHLVHPGLLSREYGAHYDELFEDRQEGDYVEFFETTAEDVAQRIATTREFVTLMERFTPPSLFPILPK